MLAQSATVVLIGMESVGKTTLFSRLTGQATGEEANFRGSTVLCRREKIAGADIVLVDTPGIRGKSDSETTRLALREAVEGDVVIFVVRGTHARSELRLLFEEVPIAHRKLAIVFTFMDKVPSSFQRTIEAYGRQHGIPVAAINGREFTVDKCQTLVSLIQQAREVSASVEPQAFDIVLAQIEPAGTWFDRPIIGPWLSLLTVFFLFAFPVYVAYEFASWAQPYLEQFVLDPLRDMFTGTPAFVQALLTGDYGLLTLGPYSFLWAFPVVFFIGITVALAEETGVKDRITDTLDPWLRVIGLHGRDLIPVLTGFGCNVVGVLQSRACSACTRRKCVALISFGSACSYQIGATLSLFGAAGHPLLFLPYLLLLFIVGALHTRLWYTGHVPSEPLTCGRTFLQRPTWKGLSFRVRSVIKQFMLQAMPIFLLICVVAAALDYSGISSFAAGMIGPALSPLGLPEQVGPGILFSMIRKDGMLTLNQGEGTILASLSTFQVFVLVYLASTLSACLVTVWSIRKEMGVGTALRMVYQQLITSIVSTFLIVWIVGCIE
jgi:ferrous iron transport protein B